jgi:hypothetical protein
MERDTSNRFGAFRSRCVCLLRSSRGLLGATWGKGASLRLFSLRDNWQTGADTSGPVVAEIRPGSAQGELRLVVVPPGQAVQGMVPAHQIRQAATAPDRDAKELRTSAVKVAAPVTTVGDASAEVSPLN